MNRLEGKTALVTGAGTGIGRSLALALSLRGVRVALAGRTAENLESVRKVIGEDLALSVPTDLANAASVQALANQVLKVYGGLDVLVHSAGIWSQGTIDQTDLSELDLQFAVNCRGPFLLTQLLLPALRESHGQIVFVNSSVGVSARAKVVGYSMTKHGLRAFADALREECTGTGVRVLSLFCGRTATPMQRKVHEAEGKMYRPESLLQPEDVADMIIHSLNLPPTAEVTDLHIRQAMK